MSTYYELLTDIMPMGDNQRKLTVIGIEEETGKIRLRFESLFNGETTTMLECYLDQINQKAFKLHQFYNFSSAEMAEIIHLTYEKFSTLHRIAEYKTFGWQRHNGKIIGYNGSVCYDQAGNTIVSDVHNKKVGYTGEFKSIQADLRKYLLKTTKRQIVFLSALSALLCGLLEKNFFINLVGDSSSGKTVATKLAMSCFSKLTNTLIKSWASTENAIIKGLDGFNGLPVLYDDTQNSEIKRFQQVIYHIYNGVSKSRIVKGNNLAEVSRWNTAILSSSEISLLDSCKDLGVVPRLFEMYISNKDLFDNEAEAEYIENLFNTTYGVTAPLLISEMFKQGLDCYKEAYETEINEVRKGLVEDEHGILGRCAQSVALITLTGKIAKEALGIDFDIRSISEVMMNVYRENLNDLLEETPKEIVVNQFYPLLVEKIKSFTPIRENVVLVPSKVMTPIINTFAKEYKLKPKRIKCELVSVNLLIEVRGNFCETHTIDGDSIRGYEVVLKGV